MRGFFFSFCCCFSPPLVDIQVEKTQGNSEGEKKAFLLLHHFHFFLTSGYFWLFLKNSYFAAGILTSVSVKNSLLD